MKINVVRRKWIKPCTPTPEKLKTHKISYTDELAPSMNIGLLLFYPSKPETMITQLQQSLANILPKFYPLAGRYLKSEHCVDCSDEGAEFVEAEADVIEGTMTTEQLNSLLPRRSYEVDEATDPLLSVQITEVGHGGGAVIGISASHRISDASSLATLVAAWSEATTTSSSGCIIIPSFDESPAFFPGRNWENPLGSRVERDPGVVVKRLCFSAEAIASARSKLTKSKQVSKVLVVSALIAQALIRMDRAKHGRARDCFINHAVNMRGGRTVPNLHKHAYGNLVLQSLTRCISISTSTAEVGIQELVDLMAEALAKTVSQCAEVLSLGSDGVEDLTLKPVLNALPRLLSREAHVVWFSDWSKFGFYEVDFGWGKPASVGVAPLHGGATTLLMENRGGDGIQAWLHLHKDDMPLFLEDDQIRYSC